MLRHFDPLFQVHVFQQFPFLPISRSAFRSCGDFVKNGIPTMTRATGEKFRFNVEGELLSEQSVQTSGTDDDKRTIRPNERELDDLLHRSREESNGAIVDEYPRPSVRASGRAISHPNIASLCMESEQSDSRKRTISFFASRRRRQKI